MSKMPDSFASIAATRPSRLKKSPKPRAPSSRNGQPITHRFMRLLIGTIASARAPVITIGHMKQLPDRQKAYWPRLDKNWRFLCSRLIRLWCGKTRTNALKFALRTFSSNLRSNLHLELFALLQRGGETGQQLRNHLEVFEADHLHGRMHVAIRQADQRASYAPTRPENGVGVRPARVLHGFVLLGNPFCACDL